MAPEKLPAVADKAYRHADLDIPAFHQEVRELPVVAAAQASERLARLDVNVATARIDKRSSNFVTLMPTTPLVPSVGVGNRLGWSDLGVASSGRAVREQAAWEASSGHLQAHQADLGIDVRELSSHRVTSHGDGDLYQIFVPRVFDSIPVRDSYISAVIGQGNLTL